MKTYIEQNRKVYDETAEEFQHKKNLRTQSTVNFVNEFLAELEPRTPGETSILELGPGSGYASMLLGDKGYKVTAIEFSEPMAALAQKTAPKVKMVVDDFLTHDFRGQRFDGVLAVAFIHLFTSKDAETVVENIFNALAPLGVAYISTTKHDQTKEGFMPKTNFASDAMRFRHQYTRAEVDRLLTRAGFQVSKYSEVDDVEVSGKVWMNFIVQRPK